MPGPQESEQLSVTLAAGNCVIVVPGERDPDVGVGPRPRHCAARARERLQPGLRNDFCTGRGGGGRRVPPILNTHRLFEIRMARAFLNPRYACIQFYFSERRQA